MAFFWDFSKNHGPFQTQHPQLFPLDGGQRSENKKSGLATGKSTTISLSRQVRKLEMRYVSMPTQIRYAMKQDTSEMQDKSETVRHMQEFA